MGLMLGAYLSVGFVLFWCVLFLHLGWADRVGENEAMRVCTLWGLLWPLFFVIWLVRGRVFG